MPDEWLYYLSYQTSFRLLCCNSSGIQQTWPVIDCLGFLSHTSQEVGLSHSLGTFGLAASLFIVIVPWWNHPSLSTLRPPPTPPSNLWAQGTVWLDCGPSYTLLSTEPAESLSLSLFRFFITSSPGFPFDVLMLTSAQVTLIVTCLTLWYLFSFHFVHSHWASLSSVPSSAFPTMGFSCTSSVARTRNEIQQNGFCPQAV